MTNTLRQLDCSIVIRKLSPKTRIDDCAEDLKAWLDLDDADIRGMSEGWRRYMMISDMPYDVWMCTIKGKRWFGKSLFEVAAKAGITA